MDKINTKSKNNTKRKRKIFLVPHTHWDREWYFTYDTGNVLLNSMLKDFINYGSKGKLLLDGQNSLIDDYLKWNKSDKENIEKLLKQGNLQLGPLYTQPDVFNSQAETILRNFEIGKKVATSLGVSNFKTVYMPDTFGFGANLPQIFKLAGYNKFVFWRGMKKNDVKKSVIFKWKGIDGTYIKSLCLNNGYFSLGMYYPYNGKKSGIKYDPIYFAKKVVDRANDTPGMKHNTILPLGGDQAPYMYEAASFINKANLHLRDDEIILESNYDKFLDNFRSELPIVEGSMRTPYAGKIHRTITSSRYDIKKLFREAEIKLYNLLEPLEIVYSILDNDYDFQDYKDEMIHKPLFLAQAHDSLGGCNTDETNMNQISRLKRIHQNIDSQIDLIMKRIIQEQSIENESLVVFNPAPFPSNVFQKKIIYSASNKKINIKLKNYEILTLKSKNISLVDKPLYEQHVLISLKNLKPLELKVINLPSVNKTYIKTINTIFVNDYVKINGRYIQLKIKEQIIYINFSSIEDKGDSYDFSPGKKIELSIKHIIKNIKYVGKDIFLNIVSKINNQTFNWDIFIHDNKIRCSLKTINKFKNQKFSLNISTKNGDQVYKSQHMAIIPFEKNDYYDTWSEDLSEYPAQVDANDGLVKIGQWNILTRGNNELFKIKNGVSITLFRSYPMITNGGMKWRPSTSGLSWKHITKGSQLQKELVFDFEFNLNNSSKAINENKFTPYIYKVQNRNFIANKMSKFVINNILNKKIGNIDLKIDNSICISSMRRKNNSIQLILANMSKKEKTAKIIMNNKIEVMKFSPYKIVKKVITININKRGKKDE